jgi:transposase
MKKNISKTTKMQKQNPARKQRVQAVKQRAQARKQRAQARKKGETPQAGRKQAESWGKQRVTIGLDLGDRKSKYCVFDGVSYLKEADVPTTPEEMKVVFGAMQRCRIAMEVGTHSPWVSAVLKELGYEVYVANAREVRAITKSKKKNDKLDARKLARLAHADPQLLSPIKHRSMQAQMDLLRIRARAGLVEARTGLVNMVRGLVKAQGQRIRQCDTDSMSAELLRGLDESLIAALKPAMKVIETLTEQIQQYDKQVEELAEKYPETQRLRQVTGVGPLIATAYVLTLEDAQRFSKSRHVGGYLGLTPTQKDSGDSHPQLRITKAGDSYLRTLLVQGAHYILGAHGPDTDLRRWGQKLAGGGSDREKQRAVVAVARKLAVLLHRLWKTGETYEPLRNSEPSRQAA